MKRFRQQGVVVVVAAVLLIPTHARADLWGADLGPLTSLVAQGAAEMAQAAEQLAQLKQTYDETRKYVGMVEDVVSGFKEFGDYASSVVTNPTSALESVMPEAFALSRDLQSPQSWGSGTGELANLVRVCLGTGDCAQFKQAVTAQQARDSISKTFGTAPVRSASIETVDIEAAKAISGGTAHNAKSTVSGEQARALMEKCLHGTDNGAVAACQAAANVGQLMQVEETASLNQQMAESTRLQALQLAEKNAEKKRSMQEVLERQRLLEAGTKSMAPPRFQLIEGAGPGGAR